MIKLNTMTTSNKYGSIAVVSFDKVNLAKKWLGVLIRRNIRHIHYIYKCNDKTFYSFKMFGVGRIIFDLCVELNGVLK